MTFKEYIAGMKAGDFALGHFVLDAQGDPELPNAESWEELEAYLVGKKAKAEVLKGCPGILVILRGAGPPSLRGASGSHAVDRLSNPAGGSSAVASLAMLATLAKGGPMRQAAIISSMAAASPAKKASTLPSRRLRTQPRRPRRVASCTVQARYHTP